MKRTLSGAVAKFRTRALVAAMLAAEMAVAPAMVAITPTVALADTAITYRSDAGLIIHKAQNNDNTYKAFQVFKAKINATAGQDRATHVAWAEDGTVAWTSGQQKTAILNYLNSKDYGTWLSQKTTNTDAAAEDPQNALEFISEKISGETTDIGGVGNVNRTPSGGTQVYARVGDSFALGLAQALKSYGTAFGTSGDTATLSGQTEGYYLIITDPASIGDSADGNVEMGTAPIWIALGGSVTEIDEKAGAVSFDLKVAEDSGITGSGSSSTVAWGEAADANRGQNVLYRMSCTLPKNVLDYAAYPLTLKADVPSGMTAAPSSVKVLAFTGEGAATSLANHVAIGADGNIVVPASGCVDITSATGLNAAVAPDGDVVMSVENIRAVSGLSADKNTCIAVYYQAYINDSATMGQGGGASGVLGNQTQATMTYAKDPVDATQVTVANAQTVQTYTYQLEVTKHDMVNGQTLGGAQYSIQVADDSSDVASRGKYVKTDGSLADAPAGGVNASPAGFIFTTGNTDGKFTVPRIDEGAYIIHEVTAPTANGHTYKVQDADVKVVVGSNLAGTGNTLGGLTITVSGGEAVLPGHDQNMRARAGSYGSGTHNTSDTVELASGKLIMMVVDDYAILLPVTGMSGPLAAIIMGCVLIATSVVGTVLLKRRRHIVRQ